TAQKVADDLVERGFACGAVHGDLGQIAREKALDKFRSGKIDVLVATDVAARGIDIDDVTHVINYQCPEDEKTYVHRIGRTGRAGRTGIAITLVDWDDVPRWQLIDKALDLGIPDPIETYSSSPHLFEELNIPTDATGRVRKAAPAAAPAEDGEKRERAGREAGSRPKRNRVRRRTVRGRSADGSATDAAPTGADDSAATEAQPAASETGEDTGAEAPARRRRRRRRTRSGEGPAGRAEQQDTSSVEAVSTSSAR
uniref:helicase-related protein n=1 Tax=Rhodococcus sp. R1101 TaxID=1170698 RepID=UPI0003605EF7